MRKLVYALYIHDPAELLKPENYYPLQVKEVISQFWEELRNYLQGIKIDRVYIDSQVVGELAENEDYVKEREEILKSSEKIRTKIKTSERYQKEAEKFFLKDKSHIQLSGLSYEELKNKMIEYAINDLEIKANMGSRAHQLALDLVKRGARLMKTEDIDLVFKEARFVKLLEELYTTPRATLLDLRRYLISGKLPPEYKELAEKLKEFKELEATQLERMESRDKYIADRINKTLKDGETGLLLIGAAHEVEPYLDKNIEVIRKAPIGLRIVKERKRIYFPLHY